ncbi:Uncharacterised protein [Mycobacterium tuberculosis]|nr:Uncharacterised protein [Mycobacterium tuberculosis]
MSGQDFCSILHHSGLCKNLFYNLRQMLGDLGQFILSIQTDAKNQGTSDSTIFYDRESTSDVGDSIDGGIHHFTDRLLFSQNTSGETSFPNGIVD